MFALLPDEVKTSGSSCTPAAASAYLRQTSKAGRQTGNGPSHCMVNLLPVFTFTSTLCALALPARNSTAAALSCRRRAKTMPIPFANSTTADADQRDR